MSRITRKGKPVSKQNLLRRVMGPAKRPVYIKFIGIEPKSKAILYRSGDQYHFVLEIIPRGLTKSKKSWPSEKPLGDVTDIMSCDNLQLDVYRTVEITE